MTTIPDRIAPGNLISIADEEIVNPSENDLWFDSINDSWKKWDGNTWVAVTIPPVFAEAPEDGLIYARKDGAWVATVPSPIGGIEMSFRWDSGIGATEPVAGDVRVNNVDQTLATELYISTISRLGNDLGLILESIRQGEYLGVWEIVGDKEGVYYSVTGPIISNDAGAWYTIPISFVPGTTAGIDNDASVSIFLIPNYVNKLPAGGTIGQVLAKASDNDFDTEWVTLL